MSQEESNARAELPEEEKLQSDLRKYRQMALDMGAYEAAIIPISWLKQRIRVRLCDTFPRAFKTGTSFFSPPHFDMPWKYTKQMLNSYRYAIIVHLIFEGDNRNDFTGPASSGELDLGIERHKRYWPPETVEYWSKRAKERRGTKHQGQIMIAETIEAEARKDGHQFALGGMGGSCLRLCRDFGSRCIALTTGLCRNPGKSRPCGTAPVWGLDYQVTYAKLGWGNWVMGWSAFPEDFPLGPLDPLPGKTAGILID